MIGLRLNLSHSLKSGSRPPVLSLVAAMLLFSALSAEAKSPAVLLLPFENASGADRYDALANGMPDILTACLSQYPDQIVVVERSTVAHAMTELGLSIESYTNQAEQLSTGAIVGADLIVRGSFTLANGALQVEAITFSVTDATLVAAITATLASDAIIERICSDLAAPLAEKITRLPAQTAPSTVDNVEEQALMMEGLNHYYTSDFIAAIAPFLKLVRLAQENESAQYWLGKSFADAGLADFAAVQLSAYLEQFPASHRADEVRAIIRSLAE